MNLTFLVVVFRKIFKNVFSRKKALKRRTPKFESGKKFFFAENFEISFGNY
jgi:hypothetical protein